jgi:hypothetical protein
MDAKLRCGYNSPLRLATPLHSASTFTSLAKDTLRSLVHDSVTRLRWTEPVQTNQLN